MEFQSEDALADGGHLVPMAALIGSRPKESRCD